MDTNSNQSPSTLAQNFTRKRPLAEVANIILAVDDNPDDLFLLEHALSLVLSQHCLLTAADGLEAEELLQNLTAAGVQSLPLLVFLDINMPRLNGFQFLQRLKQKPDWSPIPVIMLSSFDRADDRDVAYKLGAAACLAKPPSPVALHGLVKTLSPLTAVQNTLLNPRCHAATVAPL
jgi:CheY-like chemotaxis protein